MSAGTATYVYCVMRRTARPSVARVPPGLPGATRPEAVRLRPSLWLITAHVPLHTYGPDALAPALRDIQWVGDVAVAHEAVVEYFTRLRGATVVPMKLFTMFSSLERAIADTRAREAQIDGAMKRIAGCEEWGVRILESAPARRQASGRPMPVSGAAFLMGKKEARDAAIERGRVAAAIAEDVFRDLESSARDTWRRDSIPEGATTPPLLDAAFLVPVAQRARFRAAADRHARRCAAAGVEMTLTGPWPAYNFVHAEPS